MKPESGFSLCVREREREKKKYRNLALCSQLHISRDRRTLLSLTIGEAK